MPWGLAAAVAGAAISADAAGDTADAQAGSARDATAAQLRMFEQSREDQQPWMQRGNEAGNMLAMYLGIPSSGLTGTEQARMQELLRLQQQSSAAPTTQPQGGDWPPPGIDLERWDSERGGLMPWMQQRSPAAAPVAFGEDLQRELQGLQQRQGQASQQQNSNPLYGSLLRPYTGENLLRDPGYQFRLNEGLGGVERSAAARGGLFSGATLRALERYGQDYASGEYMNAFNRNLAGNQNTFNMLSGVSGTGQVSAQQVGNQGIQTGGMVGSNMIGAGNARGAGYIGQSNAWTNALNQGVSAYNNRRPPNNNIFRYDDPYRNPGYYGGDEGE